MTLKEYQSLTIRTNKDLGSKVLNNFHMIVGMHSEFNELHDAFNKIPSDHVNIAEEITDYAWYLSNYCNFEDIQMSEIFSFKDDYYHDFSKYDQAEQLEVAVSRLTDIIKKENVYNKVFSKETKIQLVISILERINDCYKVVRINPEDAMEKNINKLKVRYPEKFTDYHANNRDLDKEYETLK